MNDQSKRNLHNLKISPETQQQLDNMVEWQRELILDLAQFLAELLNEGDRAAVVIGAARTEVALEGLLKSIMSHHSGGSDNLFDPDRPLGTFSAKIGLAHRLNLIDDNVEHALQMLRKIRNDFAHSVMQLHLSESTHRNRVMELTKMTKKSKDAVGQSFHAILSKSISMQQGSPELRDFCTAIFILLVYIELAAAKNTRFVPQSQASFT